MNAQRIRRHQSPIAATKDGGDRITASAAADEFGYVVGEDGVDRIAGFNSARDSITLYRNGSYRLSGANGGIFVDIGAGSGIFVEGVSPALLSANDNHRLQMIA